MAKLEELDEQQQQQQPDHVNSRKQQQQKKKKEIQGSTKFFVFVDYLFLHIFFGFLIFILFKMVVGF